MKRLSNCQHANEIYGGPWFSNYVARSNLYQVEISATQLTNHLANLVEEIEWLSWQSKNNTYLKARQREHEMKLAKHCVAKTL